MVKASESSAVPEPVMDAANNTLSNLQLLRTHFNDFLSLSDPQTLSQMPPLQRANALFILAKITSTLLACNPKNASFFIMNVAISSLIPP